MGTSPAAGTTDHVKVERSNCRSTIGRSALYGTVVSGSIAEDEDDVVFVEVPPPTYSVEPSVVIAAAWYDSGFGGTAPVVDSVRHSKVSKSRCHSNAALVG